MSESFSETSPEILVNGEQQVQQQDDAATAEEPVSSVSMEDTFLEEIVAAEKEVQTKMQTVFQQVRNQIRSQVGVKAPKSSILELVQKLKDRETKVVQGSSEPGGKDANGEEENQAKELTDESKDGMNLKEEELCAIFEEKLDASKKALREEFRDQISQVRKEMQAYTDQALTDLECKMQSWRSHNLQQTHPKEQQQGKAPDTKQRPSLAASLVSRRGRVLTRTMTTIIPNTCAPVNIGPRAKSETLSSSKGETRHFVLKDPALSLPGSKPYKSSCKALPPARPPLQQRKKPNQAKAKTVN